MTDLRKDSPVIIWTHRSRSDIHNLHILEWKSELHVFSLFFVILAKPWSTVTILFRFSIFLYWKVMLPAKEFYILTTCNILSIIIKSCLFVCLFVIVPFERIIAFNINYAFQWTVLLEYNHWRYFCQYIHKVQLLKCNCIELPNYTQTQKRRMMSLIPSTCKN